MKMAMSKWFANFLSIQGMDDGGYSGGQAQRWLAEALEEFEPVLKHSILREISETERWFFILFDDDSMYTIKSDEKAAVVNRYAYEPNEEPVLHFIFTALSIMEWTDAGEPVPEALMNALTYYARQLSPAEIAAIRSKYNAQTH